MKPLLALVKQYFPQRMRKISNIIYNALYQQGILVIDLIKKTYTLQLILAIF